MHLQKLRNVKVKICYKLKYIFMQFKDVLIQSIIHFYITQFRNIL